MSYGFRVFNTSGFLQIDSEALALKTFAKQSTSYLSVAQRSAYQVLPHIYDGDDHTVLQNIQPGDLIFCRPTNTNMFPCTVAISLMIGFTSGTDVAVRAVGSSGSIEFAKFVDVTDSEYTSLVNGLTGTRYGVRVRNSSNQVIFHSDLTPPRISSVLTTDNAYATFGSDIPYVCLNPLSTKRYEADGSEFYLYAHAAEWKTVSGTNRVVKTEEAIRFNQSNQDLEYTWNGAAGQIFVMEDG